MSADKSKDKKPSNSEVTDIDLPEGRVTGSDIPDGVSEDVYKFWKENGTRIIVYSVIALVAFLGVQGLKQFSVSREASLRESFAQLNTTEEKVEFAEKHKSHGLAGYAYLQAAKEAFENKAFDTAADYYQKAAKGLEKTDLLAIAMLGEASCRKETGDVVAASGLLEQIISNDTFAEGIRAEAMFKRIMIALKNGEDTVVEDYTTKLEAIDNTQIWAQRLEGIKYYQ